MNLNLTVIDFVIIVPSLEEEKKKVQVLLWDLQVFCRNCSQKKTNNF